MQQLPPFPDDEPGKEPAEPAHPGQPTHSPSETPPVGPDRDEPDPGGVPPETSPPAPDIDEPAPDADPNPTPISPIGKGMPAPPD